MRDAAVFCALDLVAMAFLFPFSREMKDDPFPSMTLLFASAFCLSWIAMPFLLGWFILEVAYAS